MVNNPQQVITRIAKINRHKNLRWIKIQRCTLLFSRIKYSEFRILIFSDCVVLKIQQSMKINKMQEKQLLMEVITIEIKIICHRKTITVIMAHLSHIRPIASSLIIIALHCHSNSLMC